VTDWLVVALCRPRRRTLHRILRGAVLGDGNKRALGWWGGGAFCARPRRWMRGRQLAFLWPYLGEDWRSRFDRVGRADLREGGASQCGLAQWQLKWWLAQVRRIFSFRRPIGTDPPALGPRIGLHGQSTNGDVVRGTNGVGHSHAFMQAQPV
jgi:hypothetical protein